MDLQEVATVEVPFIETEEALVEKKILPKSHSAQKMKKTESSKDDPGKTLTIHEADYNQIDVSVFVKMKNVDKYTEKIGFDYKFYCTECKYKCETLQKLAQHINKDQCEAIKKQEEDDNDIYTVYCNSQEQGEHNYARFDPEEMEESLGIDYDDHADEEIETEPKNTGEQGGAIPRPMPVKTKMASPEKLRLGMPATLAPDLNLQQATSVTYECPVCSYTNLHSEEEYQQHSQCHYLIEGENTLQCYYCVQTGNVSFTDIQDWVFLREHLHLTHGVDFQIPCQYCNKVMKSHAELREHEKVEHILSCPHCLFTSVKATHMEVHWSCHEGGDNSPFVCFICGYKSSSFSDRWSSMQSHIIVKHPGIHEANFTCIKCGRGYQDHYSYTNHVASCQYKRPDISCVICQTKQTPAEYTFHLRSCIVENRGLLTDRMTSNGLDPWELKCSEHNLSFINDDCMLLHFVHEHLGPVFPNYNGPRKELFAYLKEKASLGCEEVNLNSPAVKCAACHQMIPGKLREFKQHMLTEHSDSSSVDVLCPLCDRKFGHYSSVLYHLRTVHAGLPKRRKSDRKITQVFRCEKCSYESVSRQRLKNHMLSVHQGVHRFRCPDCSYACNEQSTMKRHIQRHKGLLPHACDVEDCGYKCQKRYNLVRHYKKYHNIQLPVYHKPYPKRKNLKIEKQLSQDQIIEKLEPVFKVDMDGTGDVHTVHLSDGTQVEVVNVADLKLNEANFEEVEAIEVDSHLSETITAEASQIVQAQRANSANNAIVATGQMAENGGIALGNILDVNGDMTITLQSLF